MNIICDLYAQWIVAIRQELAKAGCNHYTLIDQDCAITWQSWKRRSLPAGVRIIRPAKGFICPSHLRQGLSDFEGAFTTGAAVWPWQSKSIDSTTVEDGLYNDYGVIHLHLGIGFEQNGYINRTNELLFAVIDSSTVHEIGIYRHGDWYELDILDIIEQNWPNLLDQVTIHALDVSYCPKTRKQEGSRLPIRQFRLVMVGSGVVHSGHGKTIKS